MRGLALAIALMGLGGVALAQSVPLDMGTTEAPLSPAVLKAMVERQGGVIFGSLDKVTARVSEVYAPIDVPVRYGSLQITARKCNKRPPEENPEQSVFVEVDDMQAGAQPKRIFTGWMFWSSPALNAVEHAVYDIWLKDCMTSMPEASRAIP